jgi:hypothetical protein
LLKVGFGVVVTSAVGACSVPSENPETPGLLPRGTTLTTVKPTRQNLENKLSLSGKVTLNPIYGLEAPANGQVRYADVQTPQGTPTKPTRAATIYATGNQRHNVDVPAGSVFSGRLVDDRATVLAGMPVVSAKYVGYGIVAEIEGGQAYKIAGALGTVKAQIQGGPGPFTCTVLGSIAALPAGTVPAPPVVPVDPAAPVDPRVPPQGNPNPNPGSESTGLRLVCVAPADVKMINGASATVELVTASASNALVLPVEAVAGGQGAGKVDIVKPDGTRETKDVVLGITDGRVVEIKSGLTGDETIAVPGPNIPAPQQVPGGGRGDKPFPMPEMTK